MGFTFLAFFFSLSANDLCESLNLNIISMKKYAQTHALTNKTTFLKRRFTPKDVYVSFSFYPVSFTRFSISLNKHYSKWRTLRFHFQYQFYFEFASLSTISVCYVKARLCAVGFSSFIECVRFVFVSRKVRCRFESINHNKFVNVAAVL